jgi:holo-[acyl-carrier protein] synthase
VIVGVGVDVVPVERFATALARTPGLAVRLFTPTERSLPVASLAARFAAKEALAKALGAPGGLRWQDAEIGRGTGGEPTLRVSGTVAAAAAARGVVRWHLSISHDGGMAVALVVGESDPAPSVAEPPT